MEDQVEHRVQARPETGEDDTRHQGPLLDGQRSLLAVESDPTPAPLQMYLVDGNVLGEDRDQDGD